VPDLEAARRILGMTESTPEEIRAALPHDKEGELKFQKHPLHKIACIGALVALRETDGWRLQSVGAPHIGEHSEADLINQCRRDRRRSRGCA
jgi:3'-5' exonuclease